ncbi:MAG: histidine kinase, partial [Myxococcales bacterium]
MTAGPLRELLLEDSADDAELVLLELRRGGFEVESRRAWTAAGMRDALLAGEWDVVLADFAMPSFTALDALRILHEFGA